MKRGFTLLELIVVIIIIGILSTLALTQYGKIIERSRGAEARSVLGDIRKITAIAFMERGGNLTGMPTSAVGIGPAATDAIPGPAAGNCRQSHYFWYNFPAPTVDNITITATRCVSGGKTPDYTSPLTLTLTSNYSTGVDSWGGTGSY